MRIIFALALTASLGACASQSTEAERVCGQWAVNTGHALQYDDCLASLGTNASAERDRAGAEGLGRAFAAGLAGAAAASAYSAPYAYGPPAPLPPIATPPPALHCYTQRIGNGVGTNCY